MNIFKHLKPLVSMITLKHNPGSDFIDAPPGDSHYEIIPIPNGPGMKQLESITKVIPPLCLKNGPWIAGGAARRLLLGERLDSGDIDLFFSDYKSWNHCCESLSGYRVIIKTKRATTYDVNGFKVQCIRRNFYKSLINLFQDFDFSACQIATDGRNFSCAEQTRLDILNQVLRFAPGGTIAKHTLIQRMSKYVNHGLIPEPGMFELVVKSGLDYTSAYNIFSDTESAIYDENQDSVEEEIIPVEELNDIVLRSIARKLGLEKIDV